MHGAFAGRKPVTGLHSEGIKQSKEVKTLAQQYLNDPSLLDLSQDVAFLRYLRDRAAKGIESEELDPEKHQFLLQIIALTAKVTKVKADIDNANSLSIAQFQLLQAEIVRTMLSLPTEARESLQTALQGTLMLKDCTDSLFLYCASLQSTDRDEALHVLKSHFARRKVVDQNSD